MNIIFDKLLLLVSCSVLYIFNDNTVFAIIPVILAILLSCLSVYFDDTRVHIAISIFFIFLCIFVPEYIIFYPLMLYDIFHTKYQINVFLSVIPLINSYQSFSAAVLSLTAVLLAISYLLKYKTNRLNLLITEYNELRDSSTEMSMQLKEKNRSILKNQDDEINLAALNERNRISREIHDSIGHMLSRALLQIGALLTITKDEVVKEGLTDLKASISAGMDHIRSSIHQMYDESIDLYAQIEHLVKEFTFCGIHFEYDINNPPLLPMRHSMIAIVKEALANVMKHSNATKVTVIFREHPAMYQIIIKDNGSLEDQKRKELLKSNEKQEYGEGMGLRNISDRVKGFNGNLNLILDNGFTLFISIPKDNKI